jgi:tripartite-type tricarboxylate transporter receptor subunit TctC
MKLRRRRSLRLVAGAAIFTLISGFLVSSHSAWSQAARTIKIVVPFPPGGAADFLARVLAEQVGRLKGLTTVVENRPGAGSAVGTEAVSRAAPDGKTLLLDSKESIINPHLRKVNYDPLTSFESICHLVSSPTVISVNNASPYRTLANLLDAARSKPGDLTLAASGPASPFQIGFEMLKRVAKVDMTFVPYPGAAPAVNALLRGVHDAQQHRHVPDALARQQRLADHAGAILLDPVLAAAIVALEARNPSQHLDQVERLDLHQPPCRGFWFYRCVQSRLMGAQPWVYQVKRGRSGPLR